MISYREADLMDKLNPRSNDKGTMAIGVYSNGFDIVFCGMNDLDGQHDIDIIKRRLNEKFGFTFEQSGKFENCVQYRYRIHYVNALGLKTIADRLFKHLNEITGRPTEMIRHRHVYKVDPVFVDRL